MCNERILKVEKDVINLVKYNLLNKENMSKQTLVNRNKAIQIILSDGTTNNRAVKNILEFAGQQSFEFLEIQKYILSGNINCL